MCVCSVCVDVQFQYVLDVILVVLLTTCKLERTKVFPCPATHYYYYSSLAHSSEQKVNEIFPDLRSNSTKDLTEIPENSVNHDITIAWLAESGKVVGFVK